MAERESASPQHDPDARLGDLFENLPAPSTQLPTPDNGPPPPGSRRAAREAASRRSGVADSAAPAPRDEKVPGGTEPPEIRSDEIRSDDTLPRQSSAGAPSTPVDPAQGAGGLEDLFHAPLEEVSGTRPERRKRRTGCLVALIIVLALIGGVVAGGVWAWNTYGDRISEVLGWGEPDDWESGLATGEALVTIQDGDTGRAVSTALYEAGVTKTDAVFYDMLIEENITQPFFPGVYALQKKMTASAALAALADEKNKRENTVGISEGGTIAASLPGIAETLQLPVEELQAAVADPAVYGVAAPDLEGWLFPAVYTFEPDVTAAEVIQRMVDRTRESLAAAGVPDADAQRILTIASIIQREGRTDDFGKVSRVIQNRLDAGMLLQMDSTAQYGYGELHAGTVSTSEEAQFHDNPWNTYVHEGLPAGPIASPGDAAIAAAMHPEDGPWLYFVTINPQSGETQFSETYEEHQRGIDKWHEWCEANPDKGC